MHGASEEAVRHTSPVQRDMHRKPLTPVDAGPQSTRSHPPGPPVPKPGQAEAPTPTRGGGQQHSTHSRATPTRCGPHTAPKAANTAPCRPPPAPPRPTVAPTVGGLSPRVRVGVLMHPGPARGRPPPHRHRPGDASSSTMLGRGVSWGWWSGGWVGWLAAGVVAPPGWLVGTDGVGLVWWGWAGGLGPGPRRAGDKEPRLGG